MTNPATSEKNKMNIKNLLVFMGLPVLVILLCISGFYIKKMAYEKKVFLHAFIVTNIGLLEQKANLHQRNMSMLAEFENQVTISRGDLNVKNYMDQAIEVHRLSKEVNDYIEQMKVDLVSDVDGCTSDNAKERVIHPFTVRKKGEYQRTTIWFGTNNGTGSDGRAHDLKMKLVEYKKALFEFIRTDIKVIKDAAAKNLQIINLDAPLDSKNKGYDYSWEMFYFYKLPLSMALTELTKWQNNVACAESTILTYLFDEFTLHRSSLFEDRKISNPD